MPAKNILNSPRIYNASLHTYYLFFYSYYYSYSILGPYRIILGSLSHSGLFRTVFTARNYSHISIFSDIIFITGNVIIVVLGIAPDRISTVHVVLSIHHKLFLPSVRFGLTTSGIRDQRDYH